MRWLLCALALASLAIAPTSAQVGRGPGFRSGLKFVGGATAVLQTLTLSNNSFPGTLTTPATTTRNILGRTAGSTFTGSISPTTATTAGPTFDNTNGTVSMTRGGSANAPSSATLTIIETLAGATGSPKTTTITVTN